MKSEGEVEAEARFQKEVQREVKRRVEEALRRGYISCGLKGGPSGGEPPTATLTNELKSIPEKRLRDFIVTVIDNLVAQGA